MLTVDVQKPALTVDGITELPPDSGRIADVAQFRVLAVAAAPTEAAAASTWGGHESAYARPMVAGCMSCSV
jgi:hypothetical protein